VTPAIRRLDPASDRAAVADLFRRSADYVRLERGQNPTPALVEAFFTDTLPGVPISAMLKLGMEDGSGRDRLLAVADIGFGYPGPQDAYLGLLQLDEGCRGQGFGAIFLRELERIAQTGGARRLFLAVLLHNPRARKFWDREGFRVALEGQSVVLGQKTHLATRMVKEFGPA
jgi:ribosomal protein S18 acetylase RimI-like enzyme